MQWFITLCLAVDHNFCEDKYGNVTGKVQKSVKYGTVQNIFTELMVENVINTN